jgi:hypothetical protein
MRMLDCIVDCHIETARKFFSVLNGTYKWKHEGNVDKFGHPKPRDITSQIPTEASAVGHLDMEIAFEEFARKFENRELRPGAYVKEYAERFDKWIALYDNPESDDIEYRTIQSNCHARFNLFAQDLNIGTGQSQQHGFNIVGGKKS